MKLIIDVDEDNYNAICSDKGYSYANTMWWIIRNGTPYNLTGDCISREALKKEVENLVVGGVDGLEHYYKNGSKSDENSWIGGVYDAWELINNAPTVFDCRSCKNNGNERECVDCHDYCNFVKYEKRPKGEWIAKEETPASVSYYCSVCKAEGIPITPFCPWCGAYMKGGTE